MPRTKLAKNATKRNRDSTKDEKTANILRDFDAQVESSLSDLESMFNTDMELLSNKIHMVKSRVPHSILSMTLKELRSFDATTFDEICANINQLSVASTSANNNSQPATSTVLNMNSLRKQSKEDEGYLSERSGHSVTKNQSQITRNLGVLSSTTRLRRSKSCCNGTLLHPNGSISSSKSSTNNKSRLTPAAGSINHNSRPRFRTPITKRLKAISVDGQLDPITPKMQPNMPAAFLRYAKAGEQIISLSGSPVIASNLAHDVANINIPIENGIFLMRPTTIQSIDRDLINKIDKETLNHLRQLQTNLNLIMNIND